MSEIIENSAQVGTKPESDFTRQRKLPFHVLIIFLINFVRGSYQDELDKFFKTIFRFDVAKRVVSKAALSKPRKFFPQYKPIG